MLRLFKNKIFIGVLCLLLSGTLSFLLLPRLYKSQASTVEVVKLSQTVEHGTVITEAMLTTAIVGAFGLPDGLIQSKSDVVGKVADTTIYAGEFLWRNHLKTVEEFEKTHLTLEKAGA